MKENKANLLQQFSKPLMRDHTIPLLIKRFYTDQDGIIIDKNTAPPNLQTEYPIFLLGDFDKSGGYRIANIVTPPLPNTFFLCSFVYGNGVPFLFANGLVNVYGQIQLGDIVTVYTDNIANPTYFIWLVVSSNSASIASIVSNTETTQKDGRIGQINIDSVAMFCSNQNQYNNPLFITRCDNIGKYVENQLQPIGFKTAFQNQNDFIDIPLGFIMNQFLSISFYMSFDTDLVTLNLKIKK